MSRRPPAVTVQQRFTTVADGDFAVDGPPESLERARVEIAASPWTWLRQVHGAEVVVVDGPGAGAGELADAAVTARPGAVLAIHTADCVPVLLADREAGVVGAAHAGWRGLEAEVVQRTVEAMESLGAGRIRAEVGPCICPRCYEFGADDLARIALRYGPDVVGATDAGEPGLDLRAATQSALIEAGIRDVDFDVRCTAEASDLFSWRARQEPGRQASVIWIEPEPAVQ